MSPAGAAAGDRGRPASIPDAWSLSIRHGSRPTWFRCVDGRRRALACAGFAPHGHWRTMTFLGALRCDRLTAPCVFDGRSMANASALMSNSSSFHSQTRRHRHHGQSRQPQVAALRRIIRLQAQGSGICRPTHPTSIRSSRPSPRSSIGCAPPRNAPSTNLATHRRPRRHNPAPRMQQLLRQRWIRFHQM